jgi:hypothetical protein
VFATEGGAKKSFSSSSTFRFPNLNPSTFNLNPLCPPPSAFAKSVPIRGFSFGFFSAFLLLPFLFDSAPRTPHRVHGPFAFNN